MTPSPKEWLRARNKRSAQDLTAPEPRESLGETWQAMADAGSRRPPAASLQADGFPLAQALDGLGDAPCPGLLPLGRGDPLGVHAAVRGRQALEALPGSGVAPQPLL